MRRTVMQRQVLAAIVAIIAIFLKDTQGLNHAIIYPKVFRIDTEESVIVNLYGYRDTAVTIDATIQSSRTHRDTVTLRDVAIDDPISLKIAVPGTWFNQAHELDTKRVTLKIQMRFGNGRYQTIIKKTSIDVSGEGDSIFVMTDRPIYKPGETVKIRVAALNAHMIPAEIDSIQLTIETENGVGIRKKQISLVNGFFSDEYITTELFPLGTYYAVAKVNKLSHFSQGRAKFIIDKYVLPPFNVEMKIEGRTVGPRGHIVGDFRARYSYGANVVGKYTYKATLHVPGEDPVDIFRFPSDPARYLPGLMQGERAGKGKFRIITENAPRKSGMTWEQLIDARATISVSVSVRGDSDGAVRSDIINGILITNSPYSIDISGNSKYFIPGLEHIIYVAVRDVVTGEPVQEGIEVTVLRTDNRESLIKQTDTVGRAKVAFLTNAQERNIPLNVSVGGAVVTLNLRSRNTGQGYLRITTARYATVGSTLDVVFRSQSSNTPEEIRYMVLCRGSILSSNKISTHGRAENTEQLSITRKMSPKIRIVGYFMNGNNMISDAVSVSVEKVCISEELTIGLVPKPNRVNVHIEGQANAYFAIRAVDKAALFLNEEGVLNPDNMFEIMEKSDMGCTDGGGENGFTVFQDAGLGAVTAQRSTPEDRSLNCTLDALAGNDRKKRSSGTIFERRSAEISAIERECFTDGRKENLADLSCAERNIRVQQNQEEDFYRICFPQFMEGCHEGQELRDTLEFRERTSRSSSPRFDSDSSHVTQVGHTGLREKFDEGWLWLLDRLNQNGENDLGDRSTPDSITSHEIDAISVHETEGVCIAKPAEVRVFKPVFVKLFLPYTVKLMEEVQLRAAIFNYGESEVTVRLRIKTDSYVCSRASQGEFHDQGMVTIQNGSSASFQFTVVPILSPQYGEGERSFIEAEVVNHPSGPKYDSLKKELKIEEPGQVEEFSGSFPLDPEVSGQSHILELDFPDDDILPGSRSCEIYGYMTFLGPLVEFDVIDETPSNLGNTVRVPAGCGEQNMKRVGPNVFVYKYFKTEEKDLGRDTIQKYIEAGYTRQLGHRNNNRWSIYSHYAPTIWLNAYVNKVFLHAKDIWAEMDVQPICDSFRWLHTQQTSSGSFSEGHHSQHYWVNIAEGGDIALTAYVLISMSEKSGNCMDDVLHQKISGMKIAATGYLEKTIGRLPNAYTTALVTYALSLTTSNGAAAASNSRLLDQITETDTEAYWISSESVNQNVKTWQQRKQTPINIEATAYALLAQMKFAEGRGSSIDRNSVDRINKIARWMVNQQNARGGFVTSQTTVIAIQSLVEYATWIENLEPYMAEPHLDITLSGDGTSWTEDISLDGSNRLHRKNLTVPNEVIQNTRRITASNIQGVGRGMLSYRCTYRTTKDPEPFCDYNIDVETESKDKGFLIKLRITKISLGSSGMAIIDIDLMTGYSPIIDTLDAIKRTDVVDGVVDLYEITDSKIILYVEKIEDLNGVPLVLGFKLSKTVDITNPNPARIRVYDYYHPDESHCTAFYAEPNKSPSILKYCRKQGSDSSDQTLCSCMDGGCPICRSRQQQLSEGVNTLISTVCRRKYAYIVNINEVDNTSMPLFVKIRATILEILYHIDIADTTAANRQIRTFIMRNDCFESALNPKNGSFIEVDNSYLVRGSELDTKTDSSGEKRFDYILDNHAIIEKVVPEIKCGKAKKKWKKCRKNCRKIEDRLTICENQEKLRNSVGTSACEAYT